MKPAKTLLALVLPWGAFLPLLASAGQELQRDTRSESEDDVVAGGEHSLYLGYAPTGTGVQWFLTGRQPDGDEVYASRAPLVPTLGQTRTKAWIDAIQETSSRIERVTSASLTLKIASAQERFIHFEASLYLNYRKVAEGNDTVLLRPYVPGVPGVTDDFGWKDVGTSFTLEEPVNDITYARVIITLELSPGSDWRVKTDGSSGLTLRG